MMTCLRSTRKTGALIWEHRSGIDQNINTVCCGWDNRGVAVGEGKVFLGQLDGNVVALDMKTGKEVWKTQIGALAGRLHDHQRADLLQGRDLSGVSGGDRSARGKLAALDAKTGKELWRFWTAAGRRARSAATHGRRRTIRTRKTRQRLSASRRRE